MKVHEEHDEHLCNFKSEMESYLSNKARESHTTQQSKTCKHSSRLQIDQASKSLKGSSHGSSATTCSNISSKRIKEEQRKVELEARKLELKGKRELELAKVSLKLQEEALQLDTDIAASNAKTKVLNKYEQAEYVQSEGNYVLRDDNEQRIGNGCSPNLLNPSVESFMPKSMDALPRRDERPNLPIADINSNMNLVNQRCQTIHRAASQETCARNQEVWRQSSRVQKVSSSISSKGGSQYGQ